MPSFLAVRAQATVEFTSPTTITQSGRCSKHTGSKAIIMRAVCSGCDAPGAHLQVDVGLGNAQVAEEIVGHVPVVVLAGVDEKDLVAVAVGSKRVHYGRDLHEIGACSGD
jgi:hypothetical protein